MKNPAAGPGLGRVEGVEDAIASGLSGGFALILAVPDGFGRGHMAISYGAAGSEQSEFGEIVVARIVGNEEAVKGVDLVLGDAGLGGDGLIVKLLRRRESGIAGAGHVKSRVEK